MKGRNTKSMTVRITAEIDEILDEISDITNINKGSLIRFLLNRSLKQLKEDSIKAGGYGKLDIIIKK